MATIVVTDFFGTFLAVILIMLNLIAAVTHESSTSCNSESSKKRTNWSGNVIFSAECFCSANSIDRVQALVRSSTEDARSTTLTVLGTGHSFNTIADNVHTQLSVLPLHKALELEETTKTVTVDAGIKYSQLCPWLDRRGFALANLASLTDITIAGSISTATHGSGGRNGNLATSVSALQFVAANGKVVEFSRRSHRHEEFPGAVVGLGAIGVITKITLDLQPAFTVRQYVYQNVPLASIKNHFETIMTRAYSVSLFTDWQNQTIKQVWLKVRDGDEDHKPFDGPKEFFGGKLATKNLHPVGYMSAENTTQQMGVPGPWYDRLPHFRAGRTASVGNELQSEYFVPRAKAVEAILAIEQTLRDQIGPHLYISEIRMVAADELWMSTAYRRDSVTIHFTWKQEWAAVRQLLPQIEKVLEPFHPRAHWGKLFTLSPSRLQSSFEKLNEFRLLAAKYDPTHKFRNDFLNTNVFTS